MVTHLITTANVLVEEALPYIQRFKGSVVVIKYGGKAMVSAELKESVMKDIALLKTFGVQPVVVHGGGPEITREMSKDNLKPRFVNGLRVTDRATIRIVKRVFEGTNREISDTLGRFNVSARMAKDCLYARQKDKDLGLVGELTRVDAARLRRMLARDLIPVISPVAHGDRCTYNINADTAAVEVAAALGAEKLTILTDVDGVLEKGSLIPHLTIAEAERLIRDGVITEGMIPKVQACIHAVRSGCRKAHLINGTVSHALLFEIFTDSGIGTEIVRAAGAGA
jgi:acetylglutamate kinase